eukprot:1448684-Prymnesium_polylepis.1
MSGGSSNTHTHARAHPLVRATHNPPSLRQVLTTRPTFHHAHRSSRPRRQRCAVIRCRPAAPPRAPSSTGPWRA